MKIIDRYIFVKFLSAFLYALAMLMVIIVVFDFTENVSAFMDYKISWTDIIFKYYANWVPFFFNLFIPLFTFISTIWFTSKLSSNNEIVAMLSGGVNFYRMCIPYFAGALSIALLAVFLSNVVVPRATYKFQTFKTEHMSKWQRTTFNFHVRNSAVSYIFIDNWNVQEKRGYTFCYDELGETTAKYRLTAREVLYDDSLKQWRLIDFVKRTVTHSGEQIVSGAFMDTVFNITPLDLSNDERVCQTMSFREVLKYIKEDKEKGGGMAKYYIIEAHKRIANSLGNIIMTILGLSVASRKNRRGVGVHLFVGIALAFSFIFLQQVSTVFSIYGGFSPALGAWVPNIIYTFVCVFMVRTCQK
jgi:lipopolysaccharide export system permease protein